MQSHVFLGSQKCAIRSIQDFKYQNFIINQVLSSCMQIYIHYFYDKTVVSRYQFLHAPTYVHMQVKFLFFHFTDHGQLNTIDPFKLSQKYTGITNSKLLIPRRRITRNVCIIFFHYFVILQPFHMHEWRLDRPDTYSHVFSFLRFMLNMHTCDQPCLSLKVTFVTQMILTPNITIL